jgi:hypothetical protein
MNFAIIPPMIAIAAVITILRICIHRKNKREKPSTFRQRALV